jgi:tetratricopeptide (TPR) repeat protein/uncharacterized RDD family membrane protein YckC
MELTGRAPRWRRGVAFLIDYALLIAFAALLARVFFEPLAAIGDYARVIGLALIAAYFGCFHSRLGGGRSLGKRLLRLKVVKLDDDLLSPGVAAARAIPLGIPAVLWGVSAPGGSPQIAAAGLSLIFWGIILSTLYLLIFDRGGRVLHDFLASTRVISSSIPAGAVHTNWRDHWQVVALICLLAAVAPFRTSDEAGNEIIKAIEQVPGVRKASAFTFFTVFSSKPAAPGSTPWLEFHVQLVNAPSDPDKIAFLLERAVFQGHEDVIGLRLVKLQIGYGPTLGIARLTKSITITTSLTQWRQHQPVFSQLQDCTATQSDADAAIRSCSFIIGQIGQSPGNLAVAHVVRGAAYGGKGDVQQAIKDFSEAIKYAPNQPAGYANRAQAYGKANELDLAIADADRAISLAADNAQLYGLRSSFFRAKGDLDKAIADVEQAIKLNANSAGIYFERGIIKYNLGDFKQAAADMHRSLELKATPYAIIFRYLAMVRNGEDGRMELEANARRLKDQKWPFAVIELFLGLGSPDAVLAAAATPNDQCEAHFYLGQWQILSGKSSGSVESMRISVQTCPQSFVEHSLALAELKRLQQ